MSLATLHVSHERAGEVVAPQDLAMLRVAGWHTARRQKSGGVRPGFIWTQQRAISARINQNFDAWPSEELKKTVRLWIGKPCFVNHQNHDPKKARGKVIAARYIENGDDKYIETILEIDAQRFPKLAHELRTGGIDSVSMGVECAYTKCSVPSCRKLAHDESEFCDHVRNHKGKTIRIKNAKTGRMEDHTVHEDCYKLSWFELSFVFEPADETAVVSRVMTGSRPAADESAVASRVMVANAPLQDTLLPDYSHEGDNRAFEDDEPRKKNRFRKWWDDTLSGESLSNSKWNRHAVSVNGDDDDEDKTVIANPGDLGVDTTGSDAGINYDQYLKAPAIPAVSYSGGSSGGGGWGGGSSSSGGSSGGGGGDTGGSLRPETQALETSLEQKYPGADIGGYRPPDGYNEHSSGSALDFMTTDPAQAAAVRQQAFDSGSDYVLWNQRQWNSDGTSSPMEDRGSPTQNHMDHVHIHMGALREVLAFEEDDDKTPNAMFEDPLVIDHTGSDSDIDYDSYLKAPTVPAVSFSGGGSGGGGGSWGGGSSSGGGPTSTPSGGPPSQSLNQALERAGIDPAMYPMIQGFSVTEGNNPSGVPTLGFTDSQAGTSLDSHAQALSQQFKDRSSVSGPFPAGGSPQDQASWMATVVGQNGVSCLVPETPVSGPDGVKPISEIVAGDRIYSFEDGKATIQVVTAAWLSKTQPVFKVRTRNRAVVASANHPFLALRPTSPSNGYTLITYAPTWLRLDELAAGDLLVQARALVAEETAIRPRLCLEDTRKTWPLFRTNTSGVRGVTWDKANKAWVAHVICDGHRTARYFPSKGEAEAFICAKRDELFSPTYVDVTEDVAWLLGALIGDGTVLDTAIYLCLFGDKRERAERIIESSFGLACRHSDSHGLAFHSTALCRALLGMGYHHRGADKRLPASVWKWGKELQRAFLEGYCDADGNHPKDPSRHGERVYQSCSRRLINDVRALHMLLGDPVSNIYLIKRDKPIIIKGKTVKNAQPLHRFVVWSSSRGESTLRERRRGIAAWLDNNPDFTLARVVDIMPQGIQDTYDIEVDGQHNFIADGLVVHNSDWQGNAQPARSDYVNRVVQNMPKSASRRLSYGETEVPEDIDTLSDDQNRTVDDYKFVEPVDLNGTDEEEIPFKHYLDSPPELLGPNLDRVESFDREQEAQGLDQDRLVENYGEIEGDPEFEDVPPRRNTMARTRAARRRLASEDDAAVEALEEALGADLDGDDEEGEDPDHVEIVEEDDGDDDDDGDHDEDDEDEDDVAVDEDDDGDADVIVDRDGDDSAPPWVDRQARVANHRRRNRNKGRKGAAMNVATRGRRRTAGDNGYTDGGPYGQNDQGDDAEAFVTQTPAAEAVVAPGPGDPQISNTENTLVAAIQRQAAEMQANLATYNRLQATKRASARPYRATADFVLSLPQDQRPAMAQHFASAFKAENPRFSPRKFFAAVGLRTADAVEEPTVVDPPLSGTDDQAVKGNDFDSVALDDVETQPKDASLKVFAAFDAWLRSATGRTAATHIPEWLRRQAARWAASKGLPVQALYPTLGRVLRQARSTGKATMNRRANDESLEVAAPQGRIDVEAPVANDTDAEAQASQYDLGDFAHNAGDDIADPELSSDSQIWAPGEKTSQFKKASGIAAVRYAESFISAGLAPAADRWKLAKQAETMREAQVIDRTRLLEAVVAANATRRPAAPQGPAIPRGIATARTASRQVTANSQSDDAALFL